jgi:hypothetical protein
MNVMSVRHVADTYGVSNAFLVRALTQLGLEGGQVESPGPSVILTRFEATFGPGIREAKAKQAPAQRPDPFSTRQRQSKPHVMRIAHAKVAAGRDEVGNRWGADGLACRPGSVPGFLASPGWRPSIYGCRCRHPPAIYPRARTGRPQTHAHPGP